MWWMEKRWRANKILFVSSFLREMNMAGQFNVRSRTRFYARIYLIFRKLFYFKIFSDCKISRSSNLSLR